MRKALLIVLLAVPVLPTATATVFINEVFINPPGSSADDTREFIELLGTPDRSLDGYAVALVNGAMTKYYPLGSIPPRPVAQEIDEFFSLDGLRLGPNGLLVIGIGTSSMYPTLLADTNFRQWTTLWNGGLDTPGKLNNDGSNTVLLLRRRPGRTQADPTNPAGLRWGKDVNPDDELITPAIDPQTNLLVDQYGDGAFDQGQSNGIDGFALDMVGASTPTNLLDDLEIVDEVSYEDDRGWEYDTDARRVDLESPVPGLPARRVHTLDDPQGFNPDCLIRVDYRTKGPGWLPAPGAIGAGPNGRNWQDTATEQWVRGESVVGSGGQGGNPQFFLDNSANSNPDAIQPYLTNVPLWLADGQAPDYDFAASNTYQIMAGRVNPLAVPYIPGDADRDGDCDADDLAKIAAVFGEPDWIFSNAYAGAPAGNDGDPAAQTRPWDVDATGDNGVEPSDLQWALNFQGSIDGRVVGRRYDSTTPAATGVYLNPNTGVSCAVTWTAVVPSGRPLTGLWAGDVVELTVRGQVAAGANTLPQQQNGIMQFVHDVTLSTAGVARVEAITALGAFAKTRAALESPQGLSGDLGLRRINGHTTSFTQGLAAAADLYRIRLRVFGAGTTTAALGPSNETGFALSTPHGLKVGRTASNGNPQTVTYPAPLTLTASGQLLPGDTNCDGVVNFDDIDPFVVALGGQAAYDAAYPGCVWLNADCDGDGAVTFDDIDPFVAILSS